MNCDVYKLLQRPYKLATSVDRPQCEQCLTKKLLKENLIFSAMIRNVVIITYHLIFVISKQT